MHVAEIKTESVVNTKGRKLYLHLVALYKDEFANTACIGYIFRYKRKFVSYLGSSAAERGTEYFHRIVGTNRITYHQKELRKVFIDGVPCANNHIHGFTQNTSDIEIIVLHLRPIPAIIFEAATQPVESLNKNNPFYVNRKLEPFPSIAMLEILNTRQKQDDLAAYLKECAFTNMTKNLLSYLDKFLKIQKYLIFI